ncbi:winged helix-turn-helix transcriptional regulator [Dongia sp.]|uniref:winged helix-turn-helix transcriptional regulator n=1 Tax=Dongia sp. TaxID=1977262 RepID=UPI0035AEFEA2
MTGYGQFCAIARAHEVLGGRWTLLIVRELLMGSRRFNDIRRGIPRISRTVLSERLQELVHVGAVLRREGAHGPEYDLTASGRELFEIVAAFGKWGQRWLPRKNAAADVDLDALLHDMARRVHPEKLPKNPTVLRVALERQPVRFLLLKQGEVAPCLENPGFPESLVIGGKLDALIGWWRGDMDIKAARRSGLRLEGSAAAIRAFPGWFQLYLLAAIKPAA